MGNETKYEKGTYLFTVPNNGIGRTFISMLRRYQNSKEWRLRVRGRHRNRREVALSLGLRKHAFDRDVPLEHAQTLVVYVDRKKPDRSEVW